MKFITICDKYNEIVSLYKCCRKTYTGCRKTKKHYRFLKFWCFRKLTADGNLLKLFVKLS